jgi:hypothetical protein
VSQYDEFSKKQKLFRCDRLDASISAPTCSTNRRSGNIFACTGCPGLGAVVDIKVVEVVPMGKRVCSVFNCTKTVHAHGMCWAHERSELGINPATGLKLPAPAWAEPFVATVPETAPVEVIDESDWKQQVMIVADDFGKVTNGDGDLVEFGTDAVVVLALREAWQAKERDWLVELSGMKPGATIARAVQMVSAVEGLRY